MNMSIKEGGSLWNVKDSEFFFFKLRWKKSTGQRKGKGRIFNFAQYNNCFVLMFPSQQLQIWRTKTLKRVTNPKNLFETSIFSYCILRELEVPDCITTNRAFAYTLTGLSMISFERWRLVLIMPLPIYTTEEIKVRQRDWFSRPWASNHGVIV